MSEAFDEIKRRCEAAGLQFGWEEESSDHEGSPATISIEFPNGSATYPIDIVDGIQAQWLVMRPFEEYKLVGDFQASWSPEHQVIECNLVIDETELLWTDEDPWKIGNVLGQLGLKVDDAEPLSPEQRVETGSYRGLTISIGPASDMHSVLSHYLHYGEFFLIEDAGEDIPRVLALRIEGTTVTEDEAANSLLDRVDNSVLSEIYVSLGLTLSLERAEDYSADLGKAGGKSAQLPLDNLLFWGKTVGVTGSGPYEEQALKKVVNLEGGIIGDDDVWQTNQLIVVGREGFDKNYLLKSVEFGLEHGFTCRYLSQEDFWRFWLGQPETTYYSGDPRIASHQGLSFLASVGFEWPSIEVVIGNGGTGGISERFNDTHLLKSRFGYSVRKGITAGERRQKLQRAITGPGALGLQLVAEHIAFLVDLNYRRYGDHMAGAIQRWESDLEWLRKTHYEGKLHSFVWPST